MKLAIAACLVAAFTGMAGNAILSAQDAPQVAYSYSYSTPQSVPAPAPSIPAPAPVIPASKLTIPDAAPTVSRITHERRDNPFQGMSYQQIVNKISKGTGTTPVRLRIACTAKDGSKIFLGLAVYSKNEIWICPGRGKTVYPAEDQLAGIAHEVCHFKRRQSVINDPITLAESEKRADYCALNYFVSIGYLPPIRAIASGRPKDAKYWPGWVAANHVLNQWDKSNL